MKPRFTTPGILKRAGVNQRIEQPKKNDRDELIRVLKIARNGMTMMHGLMFYDDATETSKRHHERVDFSIELDAIKRVLGK